MPGEEKIYRGWNYEEGLQQASASPRTCTRPDRGHVKTNAHAPFQLERRTILCALRGHAIGIRPKKMSTLRNETFQRTQSIASSRWLQMFLFYTGLLPRSTTGAGGLPDAECHNHNKSHMLAQIGQYHNNTRHEHCVSVFICTLHITLHLNLHLD